ncbi:hypothetical protein [Halomontanus rarus]|uniref:hypothetical protein n=1 Tax=Halomontanus rarus TaxID=3034020 RepID=UPI0023E8DA1F|nr:hypothetical protein [Halovivax sp. TS33]
MSVRTRVGEWDYRNREKWWYVFGQLYVLWGVFASLGVFLGTILLVPGVIVDLGPVFGPLVFGLFVVAPFTTETMFMVPACALALVTVYWRYKRLYQRNPNVQ